MFADADLSSADLSACNVSRASFGAARLTRCNLSGAIGFEPRHIRLLHPDLQGVKLAGLDLSNCVAPVKADLTNADFSGCTMQCAQLAGECPVLPKLTSRPCDTTVPPQVLACAARTSHRVT